MDPLALANRFALPASAAEAVPFGNGHIHNTFRIRCEDGSLFLLQQINTGVFRQIEGLMQNIQRVTAYLRSRVEADGGDTSRECLRLIPTKEGELYLNDESGVFRLYAFIRDPLAFDRAETPLAFRQAGEAFGRFLKLLDGFDASSLCETIPDFHHTPKRYAALEEAVKQNAAGRLSEVSSELAFVRGHVHTLSLLTEAADTGRLPLRVTHNDTKLNNILFDRESGRPLCIVDLDTVMPGLSLYDFGDAIRSGAALCAEDEADVSRAGIDLTLFEAYTKGFLSSCADILTPSEIALLPQSAYLLTMETGIRFLTDYLNGDTYFKIRFPDHNLRRARNQLAMAAHIEQCLPQMEAIVSRIAGQR